MDRAPPHRCDGRAAPVTDASPICSRTFVTLSRVASMPVVSVSGGGALPCVIHVYISSEVSSPWRFGLMMTVPKKPVGCGFLNSFSAESEPPMPMPIMLSALKPRPSAARTAPSTASSFRP